MQILTLSISIIFFTANSALNIHVSSYASYVACQKRHCTDYHDPREYGQPAIWAMCVCFRNLSFAGTGAGSGSSARA